MTDPLRRMQIVAIAAFFAFAGCQVQIDEVTIPNPDATSTPTATATPRTGATATPRPTATASPSATPGPTATPIPTAKYYVAPNGSDSNAGTLAAPFASWEKLSSVMKAGDLAYIRGGTYRVTQTPAITSRGGVVMFTYLKGTSVAPIRIFAYPGEKPVLNLDNVDVGTNGLSAMYLQDSDWVHLKGLHLTGLAQKTGQGSVAGFVLQRATNSKIEMMEVDHIGGFGIVLLSGSNDNLFLNCDVHHLYDLPNYENANGYNITGGSDATRNTFDGCRAWLVCDDGFDLYSSDGIVTIKNSWSFWNGYQQSSSGALVHHPESDGMGFKLGPAATSNVANKVTRIITNNLAFENWYGGFDQNSGETKYQIYNNTSYKNGTIGFAFGYHQSIAQDFKNNVSYRDPTPRSGDTSTGSHNSWNGGVTVTDADFLSVSSVGADGPRGVEGALPILNFLKLAPGSDLINAGTPVGLPANGAPDLGAYEFK